MRHASHRWLAFALATLAATCGGSTAPPTDAPPADVGDAIAGDTITSDVADAVDATDGPVHTSTHDCAPVCGSSSFCRYPMGPGICPMGNDAGFCPSGCPGCPPLPPPMCSALPASCGGTPSCACLLTVCPGGCGTTRGMCYIDGDGDFVIGCLSC